MGAKFDFSGWATKNGLVCADGRVIMKDAFRDNDGQTVPLVWNHQHNETSNVLGHALLENRDEGVYAYCSFNESEAGKNAKLLVQHGDISSLSIYANKLKQHGSEVLHGAIREVSLVLSGANPGALIDNVAFAHSDEINEEEAVIYTGLSLELAHSDEEDEEAKEEPKNEEEETEVAEEMMHAEEAAEKKEGGDKTVKEVFDTLTEEQKTVVYAMIGQALEDAKHSAIDEEDSEGGKEDMKHNVFDNDQMEQDALIHDGLQMIIEDGKRYGSLKESYLAHAAEYGIDNIDWLFPEAKNINGDGAPGFIKRNPDAWVDQVMNGVHHTPFARIKMMFADLREDDARAKGYAQKGKLKKEEVFGLLKRAIEPTTIYKKQKLDRDDVIDITDFDVVSWLKGEMRMMLDEEIARAILFGDGRPASSEDKIRETNIIPICKDAALYTIAYEVNPASGETFGHAMINAAVKAQDTYEGSGNLTAFLPVGTVTDMLLLEDAQGHRMYKDMRELALAMSVDKIVKVPSSIVPNGIYGVIVDLRDYNVGADKGGAVNMFDDFDIDYNQQKYLIETRCSGALTKPFSAIVLKEHE